MAVILRNQQSGEVFACVLRNIYDLDYFGAKYWEDEKQAEEEKSSLLASSGYSDAAEWQPVAIEENKLKILNVKLNNDPSRIVLLHADGTVAVSKKPYFINGDHADE